MTLGKMNIGMEVYVDNMCKQPNSFVIFEGTRYSWSVPFALFDLTFILLKIHRLILEHGYNG